MRLVGLTGGIASGKTSVAAVLKEHGVAILSCDAAAKQGRSSRSTVLLYSLVMLLLNKVGPQGARCCYTIL